MLIPLTWLQTYIDLPESVEELTDLLTFSGLEVEGVETVGSTFEGICVAKITAVDPHPNADKLTLCTIDYGAEEPMQVVCGAPNVRVGLHTLYAAVGVTLPTGLTLKKAKIRGVESLGMLCAEDELGLSENHDGIMELSDTIAPGTPAVDVVGGPETVFELEVTPNRPDCLSVIGVARELCALTGRELKLPEVSLPEPSGSKEMQIDIASPDGCPRYTAQLLEGATLAPSPDWMQKRLRLCGVRPINNLVDITNYVMLETGQPLHAFDRELFSGETISIRPASDKEPMQTLDEREHELIPSDWVIADANGPVALAGVMGGANSEIQDTTTSILLESAAFQSSSIRATAKRLQAHTESSYRFARGCDVTSVDWVSRRAASLMVELASATLAGPMTDAYPGKAERPTLSCEWERITSLIGVVIEPSVMQGYFERLGLKVLEASDTGCTVEIPGFRLDLTRSIDLTEEIARLNGLDAIPVRAPAARIVPEARDHRMRVVIKISTHLAARGFLETMTYSLTSESLLDELDPQRKSVREVLPNPISQDQAALRTSLLPQMVETMAFNRSRQATELAVFEFGGTYLRGENGIDQQRTVAMGAFGPWKRHALDKKSNPSAAEAYADLKGELEGCFDRLHALEQIRFEPADDPLFARGQAAQILFKGKVVGRIGLLNPKTAQSRMLPGSVALAEWSLTALQPEPGLLPIMEPIPSHPSVTRDVALIVDRAKRHDDVLDIVNRQRPKDLEQVELFDVYESDKLGENRKSVAYRFTYRNAKKTLTDKAVEKMHSRLVSQLMSDLPASVEGL